MRNLLVAAGLAVLVLCGLSAPSAAAADAQLKITVTNGTDTSGSALIQIRPAGQHGGDVVASGGSGDVVTVPAGTYDVEVTYRDGVANKTIWFDRTALAGHVEKKIDMGFPIASLHFAITNGGKDVGSQGLFEVRPNGQHGADVIASGGSGDSVRLAAGTYSVDVRFHDGAAEKEIWLDNLALSGRVEKSVEMGVNLASLRIVVTNGGKDVGGQGLFEVRPDGQHGANVIASGGSGETVRLAAGTYSVDARFHDGAVDKIAWLDNLTLSGSVDKSIEIGVRLATVTWHIVNHGNDLGNDAMYQIRPGGNHGGNIIADATSGQSVRVEAGTYDIDFRYVKGLINKTVWLDHQVLSGTVDRSTDLALNPANLTVSATLNGTNMGNKARIGITPSGQSDEIGSAQGGETVLLEAGRYDLSATMPGAEGALRNAAVAGQAHLVVVMKPLRTAELKIGAPLPKTCTIEVYGVNFDFNKAVLRPESEPVLQSVLLLFTSTPSFSAEVGGHTDNIGKPDYNMKLSEARANAVKAWLVAHDVASDRVTARGYGDTHPLVPNDSDADRFKNRRVELRRTHCQ